MKFFLAVVCLLCVSGNVLGKGIDNLWTYREELSYNDLIRMNASCYPKDSCQAERNDDPPHISYQYSCSCHRQCWQFGTCCIDSPYRDTAPNHECRSASDNSAVSGYYMVHKCASNTDSSSLWKSLCEKEWNGEDDILMLSPVTSLETSTTYKNFYCFKCHETTDRFISWNLYLRGGNENSEESTKYGYSDYNGKYGQDDKTYTVAYDQVKKSWVATTVEESLSIPVSLSFEFPQDMNFEPGRCDLRMISDCPSNWTDKHALDKCRAYTAIVYPSNSLLSYKNAHCALCNDESLDNISCERNIFIVLKGEDKFSFKHLLDINKSDGDKVGEEGKCEKDELWDPYGKKCRKLKCAIPRYVIKNGRCTPP